MCNLCEAMDKIRLLIVDDNSNFREIIRSILNTQSDLEVVGESEDGLDALKKAAELLPQVVLMDVAMPRMGGLEATQRLREQLPEIKVIGLSIHDSEEYRDSMLGAGASAYLLKCSPFPELLSTIREMT